MSPSLRPCGRMAPFLLAARAWACLAVAACGGPEAEAGPFVVRDSAGVRISVSRAPAWAPQEGWRIVGAPEVEIDLAGVPAPAPDVVAALRLEDGRFAVADRGGRVLLFAADGAFEGVAGTGEGGGADPAAAPLEISSLARHHADSLLAFDPDGEAWWIVPSGPGTARRVPLRWAGDLPFDRAAPMRDGSVVVRTGFRASLALSQGDGVVRPPVWFLRFGADGALLDTLALVPGSAVGIFPLGPGARSFVNPLLGAVTAHAVGDELLFVGSGERWEIDVVRPRGGRIGVWRREGARRAVSEAELAQARGERQGMAGGSEMAERLLARIDSFLPAPAERPAYAELLLDALGNLWVGDYPFGGPGDGRVPGPWSVFDREGRWLGDVVAPEGLRLLEIGESHALGVRRGPDGTRLSVHALVR